VEPPIGIEPMTYALRGARSGAAEALGAPMARVMARTALAALGIYGDPVHKPVHVRSALRTHILLLCVNVADHMDPRPQAEMAPGPTVDLYAATHTVQLELTPASADEGSRQHSGQAEARGR
jgi:hypothetical protein